MSLTFSFPFVATPPFYSGTTLSTLVPDVFPVAIDGQPFLIDQASDRFTRQFEQRVRDSVDQSTAPGEAAINPGGLWRRGEVSWHLGAGQKYADTAEAQDYRFWKSKGVDPWTKGQLTLLNATKLSLSTSSTNLFTCTVKSSNGTEYLYVADGNVVKFSSNPFASSPTWTSVTTNTAGGNVPNAVITGLETNGTNVYIAWTGNDIWYTTPGSTSATFFYPTSGTTGQTFNAFGYAKNRGWAAVNQDLYQIGVGSGSHTIFFDNPDTTFRWVGSASGQNAVYAAGYSGVHSSVFKITIKADGTLDVPVVALELPTEEIISSIYGYLGFILLGTNKGVRFCSTDSQNNLVAGALIPTTGPVYDFTEEDRFVWFTYSNYDNISGGLGILDLSNFISQNTPAHTTDLMYNSTGEVKSVSTFDSKRVFSISGVGVIVEDTANLVSSGYIETGTYRWGVPDPKFIARVDTRATPLKGKIESYLSLDDSDFDLIGVWESSGDTENSFIGSNNRIIEARFKFVLQKESTVVGPTFTRWTARAYAAPFRSELFRIPVILHEQVRVRDKDYFFDVNEELKQLRTLINEPRVITLQLGHETISVIVEDMDWTPRDTKDRAWLWEGTAVVTMRSVQE